MRRAFYKDKKWIKPFPDVILEVPTEMDHLPLPEYIAFENRKEIKKPHIFEYSYTEKIT